MQGDVEKHFEGDNPMTIPTKLGKIGPVVSDEKIKIIL
jgi:hypothetical protein